VTSNIPFVLDLDFPVSFQDFVQHLNFLNLNFAAFLPVSCVSHVDYFDRVLIATIAPFILLAILVLLHLLALADEGVLMRLVGKIVNKTDEDLNLARLNAYFYQLYLMLSFSVFPSVSSQLFQVFECDSDFDSYNGSSSFMRVDYSISCDS
jgi:hypothetical protein